MDNKTRISVHYLATRSRQAIMKHTEVNCSAAAGSSRELLTPCCCNTEQTKTRQTGDFLPPYQPVLHF